MSSLQVEEVIQVKAKPDAVWAMLLDPEKIVTCLPGAGLDEVIDDRNFKGNIKVKVGPVTVAYKGKATLTEVDEQAKKITMIGEGREKAGPGTVKMTMNSELVETSPGVTEVRVHADVGLTGKVVSFGRGMMQGVSKEIFSQFGDRLRGELEGPEVSAAEPAEAATEGATSAPVPAGATPPAKKEQEAVDGLALFFKVLVNTIRDFFRKLFGKSAR